MVVRHTTILVLQANTLILMAQPVHNAHGADNAIEMLSASQFRGNDRVHNI